MTTTATRQPTRPGRTLADPTATITLLVLTGVLSMAALLAPNLAANELGMVMSMGMTHYMELLAVHQPRNLLIFMAIPVVLAETLAIAELAVVVKRAATPAWVRTASRITGLLAGPIMLAIFLHLLVNDVVPLTLAGAWRGPCRRGRRAVLPFRRRPAGRHHPRRTRPDQRRRRRVDEVAHDLHRDLFSWSPTSP